MREKILSKFAHLHARYPWQVLTVVIGLTLIFAFLSTRLTVTMRWSDLLPEKDPRTLEYNKIIREFTSASNIVVVVQGEEAAMKRFADQLAPRLLAVLDTSKNAACQKEIAQLVKKLETIHDNESGEAYLIQNQIETLNHNINFPVIQRVDFKIPMDFLEKHGLMLMKTKDLGDNQEMLTNPNLPNFIQNINNLLEKEYLGEERSISDREQRDNIIGFLDGIKKLTNALDEVADGGEPDETTIDETIDHLLMGEPYFLSYDKSALIMIAVPNFSAVELDRMISGTNAVQTILDETLQEYPDIRAGLTGMIPIGRDEMVYGMESANVTSIIAVIAILILLIVAFRMWVAPLYAIINLLIGILWAIGLTAVTVGQLNIMTQMMAVILMGLGIDFSIHFISGFSEQRAAGDSIESSLNLTFKKYGKGILTGGLTTACAFMTLIFSSSRGMKEMGLVTGLGLLAILVTTFLALPAFLVLRERRVDKKQLRSVRRDITFRLLGQTGAWMGKRFVWTLLVTTILTLFMIWQASKITFDQNYMHMEPKGLPSVTLQDTITKKFDMSMDYALVLTESVEESDSLARKYRTLVTTAMTEDIGLYLPSLNEQDSRRSHINRIRKQLLNSQIKPSLTRSDIGQLSEEMQRLAWNIMEIQDMAHLNVQDRVENKCAELVGRSEDPDTLNQILMLHEKIDAMNPSVKNTLDVFHKHFAYRFKRQILSMANTESIHLHMLPSSILDRYANKDRTSFLISVYPRTSIWTDLHFLEQFVKDLDTVNNRATGMPTIFQALIDIVGHDGAKALIYTVLLVFVLLLLDFRHAGYAIMAMIPLIAGVSWMVGLMRITGMQFTIINIMGLPMIIGIGIDDGVHIIHRWIHEGKKDLRTVFASTGKAILLTTLTTMLAFGSLYFSVWRGFASLGSALFLGVGACFITTLLFLSGFLGMKLRKPNQ